MIKGFLGKIVGRRKDSHKVPPPVKEMKSFNGFERVFFTKPINKQDLRANAVTSFVQNRLVNSYSYLDFSNIVWVKHFFVGIKVSKKVGYQIFVPYKDNPEKFVAMFLLLERIDSVLGWVVSRISGPLDEEVTNPLYAKKIFRTDLLGDRLIL